MRGAALALALVAGAAAADDRVRFADRVTAPMLTTGEIFLRNRSGDALVFHLSLQGGPWTRYAIAPGATALIAAQAAAVAIATERFDGDAEAEATPPLAPDAVTGPPRAEGAFHYAALAGAERGELCWSAALDRWVAQRIGERTCD